MICANSNPWDRTIRCELPRGHPGRHYQLRNGTDPQRWQDFCHFPGDDCRPAHPAQEGSA